MRRPPRATRTDPLLPSTPRFRSADLLLEIASQAAPAPDNVLVHEHCLAWLADALDRDDRDVPPALEALQDKPALLNLLGEPVWPDEAAWRDSVAQIRRAACRGRGWKYG